MSSTASAAPANVKRDSRAVADYRRQHQGHTLNIEHNHDLHHPNCNHDYGPGYHPHHPKPTPVPTPMPNPTKTPVTPPGNPTPVPTVAPTVAPTPVSTPTPAVILSDDNTDDVQVFSPSGTLLATITGFNVPQGIAGDAAGNVYVANLGASNVLVYKNDYETLATTLDDPNEFPGDVAVASSGVVAVTSLGSGIASSTAAVGNGGVSFYAAGATEPSLTVTDPNWFQIDFAAFDQAGDLYMDGRDSNLNVLVGVIPKGATAITTLSTTNALSNPGGVQITSAGSLVIVDAGNLAAYTYAPALSGTLGSPTQITKLSSSSNPTGASLTADNTGLWVADPGDLLGLLYAYPAGGLSYTYVGINLPGDYVGILKV